MIESRLICLWVGTHNQSESGSKTDAAVITRSALSPTLKHRERDERRREEEEEEEEDDQNNSVHQVLRTFGQNRLCIIHF